MGNNLYMTIVAGILLILMGVLCYFYERKLAKMGAKIFTLKELVQIRGMFVNITSHELRNPMTTIYSSIDLLENYGERLDQNEKLRLFDNVRKSIRRMTKMMDDVVLIGRLQHRKIGYNPQHINILQVCSSLVEGLEQEHRVKRIHIIVERSVSLIVHLDQSLLDHILTNLLSNALKYSEGDVTLRIKSRSQEIVFDIIDSGIGIPKDEIHKLSQLFRRCSNIGTRKGVGIGMYLVTRCVELHKGAIKVSSQEGKGAHFRVILPNVNG
jgi:signal transduction histidine kinase